MVSSRVEQFCICSFIVSPAVNLHAPTFINNKLLAPKEHFRQKNIVMMLSQYKFLETCLLGVKASPKMLALKFTGTLEIKGNTCTG